MKKGNTNWVLFLGKEYNKALLFAGDQINLSEKAESGWNIDQYGLYFNN